MSNDAGFGSQGDTQTVTVGLRVPWTLEQPPTDDVTLIVYARFLVTGLLVEIPYSANIIYDTAAPTIQSASLTSAGNSADLAGSARSGALRSYSLRVKAKDAHVGICAVATADRRASKGETVTTLTSCKRIGVKQLQRTVKLRLQSAPRYARVRNSAGDWSRWLAIAQ